MFPWWFASIALLALSQEHAQCSESAKRREPGTESYTSFARLFSWFTFLPVYHEAMCEPPECPGPDAAASDLEVAFPDVILCFHFPAPFASAPILVSQNRTRHSSEALKTLRESTMDCLSLFLGLFLHVKLAS